MLLKFHKGNKLKWYDRIFFSKFLMGGLKIFGPCWSPTGTKSDGGAGICEKNLTKAKTAHLYKIRPFLAVFFKAVFHA